jgi:hypothetical protein
MYTVKYIYISIGWLNIAEKELNKGVSKVKYANAMKMREASK